MTPDAAFRRYAPYVAAVAHRLLGRDDDVDDTVQEVFIAAVRGMHQLRDEGALKGWLARVAVRVARRKLKTRKLRRFFGLDEAPTYETVADGAVLANCGHFPWEIDVAGLHAMSTGSRQLAGADGAIERIDLPGVGRNGGRHVILLAEGRMMNLAGREPKGNSLESMDLGFLLQTLSLERVATDTLSLRLGAQPVPDDIDREVARRMLRSMQADK